MPLNSIAFPTGVLMILGCPRTVAGKTPILSSLSNVQIVARGVSNETAVCGLRRIAARVSAATNRSQAGPKPNHFVAIENIHPSDLLRVEKLLNSSDDSVPLTFF